MTTTQTLLLAILVSGFGSGSTSTLFAVINNASDSSFDTLEDTDERNGTIEQNACKYLDDRWMTARGVGRGVID